jgi:hypothetical protein
MVDIPTSNGRAAKKVVRTALGKNLANKREHGSPTATAKAALPRTPTDQLRQAHPEVSEMLIEAVVDIVGDDIGRLKFESPTSILVEN